VGTNDLPKALAFYDKVLATIGAKRVLEVPDVAVAYGKQFPEFWVQVPHNRGRAETANGVRFGFMARSRDEVHAFYKAALAAGAKEDGPPGPREHYTPAYYGCFVRDPDGHKIEAMHWDETRATGPHGA
jgi:catechol 2,3-dioxygenase-like lactoylglutathione lyase family enzyme